MRCTPRSLHCQENDVWWKMSFLVYCSERRHARRSYKHIKMLFIHREISTFTSVVIQRKKTKIDLIAFFTSEELDYLITTVTHLKPFNKSVCVCV